jgi:hypothetical protein
MSKSKILRATGEVKFVPNKNRPGKQHGFQVCRLVDEDGGYQQVEQYFDPDKVSFALQPGDYTVTAGEPKIVKDRLVIFPEFVPVTKAARAA